MEARNIRAPMAPLAQKHVKGAQRSQKVWRDILEAKQKSAEEAPARAKIALANNRVAAIWEDTVGSAGAVLNRSPYAPGQGAMLTPGRDKFIAGFQREYIGLQEWEAMTGAITKELVPVKRQVLSDYFGGGNVAPAGAGDAQGADSSARSIPWSIPDGRPDTEGAAFAGAGDLASLGSFKQSSGQASRQAASPPASARGAAASLPDGCSSRSSASPARLAGQMCIGRVSAAADAASTSAVSGAGSGPWDLAPTTVIQNKAAVGGGRAAEPAPPTSGDIAGGAARMAPRIHALPDRVKVDAPDRWQKSPDRRPMITDKDRALLEGSKDIRPAMKANASCKKRLNELLSLPRPRLATTDQHPSRAFNIVPSQNLRVM